MQRIFYEFDITTGSFWIHNVTNEMTRVRNAYYISSLPKEFSYPVTRNPQRTVLGILKEFLHSTLCF